MFSCIIFNLYQYSVYVLVTQLCPTLWPHRAQPTRLPSPWGSPGKNTGVGCHFLLQCRKVKVKVKSLSHVYDFHFHALKKEMATHSSVLAWRTPGTGDPGGLPSVGSPRVGHNWSYLAAAAVAAAANTLRQTYNKIPSNWRSMGRFKKK